MNQVYVKAEIRYIPCAVLHDFMPHETLVEDLIPAALPRVIEPISAFSRTLPFLFFSLSSNRAIFQSI
jgi:hypothetical protein